MPDIVEEQDAAGGGRLDLDHHLGIGIALEARAAAHAGRRAAGEAGRRPLQEHGLARESAAGQPSCMTSSKLARRGIRQQHDARQGARIFIDIGAARSLDEGEVAGLERGVDLFDRHAGRDEADAEQVGHGRSVGRKQRREGALVWRRHGVADACGLREIVQPQRILSEQVIKAVGEAEIREMISDADHLDAVAPIRRSRRGEARLQQHHGFAVRVRAQRVVGRRRQPAG